MPHSRKKRPLFGPEDKEAMALLHWAALNQHRLPGLHRLAHVANEGKRHPAKAKALGIIKGFADFVLLVPASGYHAWLGELKVPASPGQRPGTATEEQIDFIEDSKALGYHAGIYWGWHQMAESLESYLKGATNG